VIAHPDMSDVDQLRDLNEQYIHAALTGDVDWYNTRLADDFVCIEFDGSVLDKPAFLRRTAAGSNIAEYRLEGVDVRQYGDVALVRAMGVWRAKDGTPGVSRYTDVYVRTRNDWRVVSAQITRPSRA
jgi:ketosteroid isomerase-like protein